MAAATPKLFQPIQVGAVELQHRVVLAPLTRYKSSATEHVPYLPLMAEYYSQRASRPGTLLITEATFIAARAGGYKHVPGIWSTAQIAEWKGVTEAVHAKGSFLFMQLWALGRAARPSDLRAEDPSFPYVAPSAVVLTGKVETPRPLTIPEIKEYAALYAQAAKNAIVAGCDGVEIHSANGYIIDQFLQDVSNKRTDEYGGSIENRARFALEVVDAIVAAVGEERTAIRFSPWSRFQDLGMADPLSTFSYVLTQLVTRHPGLAYVHLVEPRIDGSSTRLEGTVGAHETNDALRNIWAPRRLVSAGNFTTEAALERAETTGDLIAFGRMFISNPDLPTRLEKGIPLNPYDRSTFYLVGENGPRGYTDQPFAT
ncbi:hypothetical protein B0H10DRAFT_1806688 [Mycena sp. CBHHK59/15]|nr:hypothetical protein B0H10DRAFT_1806688 [Mycena sp. CBHHK59/15]